MNVLTISNDGPLITETNYWALEMASRGLLFLSVNAGALRLLIPDMHRGLLGEMRPGAKYVVVSLLRADQWKDGKPCLEWMVEDGTEEPWSCHLSPGQIDRAPGPDDVGKEWVGSVWDQEKGRPHKALQLPAYCQIVPSLPWLKKIER